MAQYIEDCKHTIRYQTGIDIIFGRISYMCKHPKVEELQCPRCPFFEKREDKKP